MAENKFLIFDENKVDVMSQTEYETSQYRKNGVSLIASMAAHNKLYYQLSAMAHAIGEVLKERGHDATDEDLAGLVEAVKGTFAGVMTVNGETGPAVTLTAGDIDESTGEAIEEAQRRQDETMQELDNRIATMEEELGASGPVEAINTKIGTNSDAAGTTTVFSRLRQIYEYLTTNLSTTRAALIDRLDTTISSRASQASIGTSTDAASGTGTTLFALIKHLVTSASSGGGGIKSVQRGVTAAAGNVTITAVDLSKAFVLSVSKGSAGEVAVTGTVASHAISGNVTGTLSGSLQWSDFSPGSNSPRLGGAAGGPTGPLSLSGTRSLSGTAAAAAISGGTTDLTVKEYSARLVDATTLYCDGPVEWQVIEYK